MTEYTLTSPIVDITYTGNLSSREWYTLLSVWMVLWAVVLSAIVYGYSIVLPQYIGFEATLLGGIVLIILSMGSNQ